MSKFSVSLKARLILQNRGRLLLLKQTKPNGGNYSLVGGTVEKKEFAAATLIRESWEEAGIRLLPEDLEIVHVLHKRYPNKHRIVLYFRAFYYEGKPESKETKKFANVEWRPINDLPKNLTDTVQHVLKAYNEGKLYSEIKQ